MLRLKSAAWIICALAAAQYLQSASASTTNYVYTFDGTPNRREFNVVAKINTQTTDPAAAIVFCAQDKANCYRVDLGPNFTRIMRVEADKEMEIGSGSAAGIGARGSHSVIVKRRRLSIAVALDGRIVAEAYDDTFSRGQIGNACRKQSVAFEAFRSYDCGEALHFSDDFMTDTAVQWKALTGTWWVIELSSPTHSANPFKYAGKCVASPALAAAQPAGWVNWDGYTAKVSVSDSAGAPFGLVFYYVDPRNYHLFR